MNVLVVFAHPKRDSFTGAVVDRFVAGLAESGHRAIVADLYGEGFDPCFGDADFAHYKGLAPLPQDARKEQLRIERADALVLAFPVWWWSFPAMLKGWIDRVFTGGWAYDYAGGRSSGLLKDRPVLLLASAAADAATYAKYGYDSALAAQIDTGILAFCGLDRVTSQLFHDVGEDGSIVEVHLAAAYAMGRDFPPE